MAREEKATNREGVAAYWAKKYGEPIDCPELRRVASLAVVERERSDVAALRILHEYSALLQQQRQQQIAFLERRIHGEDKTLRDHLKDELAAGGAKAERSRSSRIESYLALLEGRVGRTRRGAPRSNVLGLARFAHPAELLQALQIGHRRTASRTDEMVRELLHRHPAWHWQVETRAMDVALAHAAHEVAERMEFEPPVFPVGRIGSESEPPNLATEINATSCPLSARNSPSPVRIRLCPSPKTPRKRGSFWDGRG